MEFTQEEKSALLRYEDIKLHIKKLETEADTLKPIITPLVTANEKLSGVQGRFELKSRPKWSFSADVTNEEAKLDALKEDEIARGIAVNNPIVYFEYRKN